MKHMVLIFVLLFSGIGCAAEAADSAPASQQVTPLTQALTSFGSIVTATVAFWGVLRAHRSEIFTVNSIPNIVAYCYRIAGGEGEARIKAAMAMFGVEFVKRTGQTPTPEHFQTANDAAHATHLSVQGTAALQEPAPIDDDLSAINAARISKGLKPLVAADSVPPPRGIPMIRNQAHV